VSLLRYSRGAFKESDSSHRYRAHSTDSSVPGAAASVRLAAPRGPGFCFSARPSTAPS